jgi:hypothetical protein
MTPLLGDVDPPDYSFEKSGALDAQDQGGGGYD